MDDYYTWREDYVRNLVPLMIWHVWHIINREHDKIELVKALDEYADFFRLTVHNNQPGNPALEFLAKSPEWNDLKGTLMDLFKKHSGEPDSKKLEAECFDLLWPHMEGRIQSDSRPLRKGPESPYGCWNYRTGDEFIELHIGNAVSPKSPFADLPALANDLLSLLKDAKAEHPHLTKVRCGTWLNNLSPFLSLFPSEWPTNKAGVKELGRGLGIWGQYMDRRGAFHEANALRFRELGHHPFTYFSCHCQRDEAINHLEREGYLGQ